MADLGHSRFPRPSGIARRTWDGVEPTPRTSIAGAGRPPRPDTVTRNCSVLVAELPWDAGGARLRKLWQNSRRGFRLGGRNDDYSPLRDADTPSRHTRESGYPGVGEAFVPSTLNSYGAPERLDRILTPARRWKNASSRRWVPVTGSVRRPASTPAKRYTTIGTMAWDGQELPVVTGSPLWASLSALSDISRALSRVARPIRVRSLANGRSDRCRKRLGR